MTAPESIGRYRVVGPLATGGMAEILLAKVFGAEGFEQAVVLKRILPHLASQGSFEAMFVDEAMIVARINHPNVVRVFELGKEEGELFLVMEYLEGEALANLMKRLASHDRQLGFALGAHIVAEACAGLHAAHEMTDLEGNPQNLVHRDVSPQNVFITYDGVVKLLDFGIATAADRVTRTEAGEIKGKFAYMSPEQMDGKPLDRRSDIFSLGTLLYESTTGRRLFQRASVRLTMRAVTERPIRPPSEVVEGYPASLEKVVMRALERDPDRRFQTATEMRRALVEVLHELSAVAPEERLAALMQELFAERIEDKREMLRRISAGSAVTHVPSAEIDEEVELPSVVFRGEDLDRALAPTMTEAAPAPRRRAGPWIGAAVAAAVAVGAAVLWTSLDEGTGAPAPPPVAQGAEPAGEASSAAEPAAEADDEPDDRIAEAPPGEADDERAGADELEAAPATVTLHVVTRPAGAVVWVDGERRGRAPLDVALPADDEPVAIAARGRGRAAITHVVPDEDREVRLRLRREREQSSGSAEPAIERFH